MVMHRGSLLVLMILAASLDAGMVVAWNLEEEIYQLAMLSLKIVPKLKGMEKYKNALKGGKVGLKVHHNLDKAHQDRIPPAAPTSSSVVGVVVDTVQVHGRALDVSTVDITVTAAALVAGCVQGAVQEVPISLFGRWGSMSRKLKSLPSATFLDCPAGVVGGASAVLGLGWGGDLVPRSVATTFSYLVVQGQQGGYANAFALFGPTGQAHQPGRRPNTTQLVFNPQKPNLYNIKITKILVGNEYVITLPPLRSVAYLSTKDHFTRLDAGVYGPLKMALVKSLSAHGLAPASPRQHPDQLCYLRTPELAAAQFPAVDVVFAGGAVMQLSLPNVFYNVDQLYDCLSILPTSPQSEVPVLGSLLQSGTTMTIQLPPGRPMEGQGTLTFETPAV